MSTSEALAGTHLALWEGGSKTPPKLTAAKKVSARLSDDRLLVTDHPDVVAPGQARILTQSLSEGSGQSLVTGLLDLPRAGFKYSGTTVSVFSEAHVEAAEATLGRIPTDLATSLASFDGFPSLGSEDAVIALVHLYQYNYFHMLAQALPLLLVLEDELPPGLPLLVGGHHIGGHPFAEEALRLIFPSRRKRYLRVGESISVERALAIPPVTTNVFLPSGIALLRDRVLRTLYRRNTGGSAIYLARGDKERNRRQTSNEGEVVEVLRRKWPSLRVVRPGLMTLQEQVHAVGGASTVIGTHGAQLTNMLWCNPGATVLEMPPDNFNIPSVFRTLAQCLDLRYLQTPSAVVDGGEWNRADQVVDVVQLRRALSQI
jgi:hypothetical protein